MKMSVQSNCTRGLQHPKQSDRESTAVSLAERALEVGQITTGSK